MKPVDVLPHLVLAAVLIGVGIFVGTRVGVAGALPEGPVDVVWDHAPCAHCNMHIGNPAFAAQLQTSDGRILNFDDPGCALRMLAADHGFQVHALWFHHVSENRWLPAADVAFTRVAHSPMGFGFGAVSSATPGSVPLAVARAEMVGGGR